MREVTTVLVLGLVSGLQSALLAMGIVLVYQARRFINFAHAQMGLVAASVLGVLVLQHEVSYAVAAPLALAVGVGVGVGVERLLRWRLDDASPTTLVIATIGISQLLLIAVTSGPLAIDKAKLAVEGYPVPFTAHIDVGGYTLNTSEIITIAVAPAMVLALQLFITRTRLGTSIRGVASNRDAAVLAGISLRRTSTIVWMLAGLVSTTAAILFAPSQPAGALAGGGTALLLRGLAAALAGRLVDFRIALVAGIALGVLEQAVLFWVHTPGLADLSVFAFLVAGLALRARGVAVASSDALPAAPPPPSTNPSTRRVEKLGWAGLVAGLLALPLVPGLQTQEKGLLLTLIVVYAIAGLSLLVLTGWAGQVAMGQFAFVGVGAFVAARLFSQGLSVPIVLLDTAMVTALVVVAVGLPALRLGRLFMAVSTLGFAFAAQAWLFRQSWFTGNDTGYMYVPRLHVLGSDLRTARSVYIVAVVVLVLVLVLLRSVRGSSLGRAIIAVRDNERMAGAHGVTPLVAKLCALALSGFVAGLAGGLWAMATRQWTFDSFEPTMSLVLLAAAIVGSLEVLYGPILGAFAVFAWPFLVPGANTLVVRSLTSGLLLVVVLLFAPRGIGGTIASWRAQLDRRRSEVDAPPRSAIALRHPHPEADPTPVPLAATGITKRFGGILAVDGASVVVAPGEIVGVIGGNGAGKSTLLDCLSGHRSCDAGAVRIGETDVTDLGAPQRALLGMARTFQDAALFAGLTVEELVLVAVDRTSRTGALSAAVGTPWAHLAELEKRAAVDELLESTGLARHAHQLTSELSTGMRRVCELAAAIAARPSVVLLDEPTSGLAQREVEAFGRRIRDVRDELGAGLLVVEHDIPLLVEICDRLYCMEQGRVIAEGHPADVVRDPLVIASCLGTDEVAIARSGTTARRRVRSRA